MTQSAIELLSPARVLAKLSLPSGKAMIRRIAELMSAEHPDVDTAALEAALLAREKLGSTTVGQGLHLPHARLASLKHAIGCFVRLAPKKPSNQAAELVFAFATPEVFVEPQLKLLAQIAQLFDDELAVQQLREAPSSEALFDVLNSWFLVHDAALARSEFGDET